MGRAAQEHTLEKLRRRDGMVVKLQMCVCGRARVF